MARPTPDVLGVSWETPNDDVAAAMLGGAPATMHGSTVHWVWLSHVLPNPYQTRLNEDPEHIIGLARSIRGEQANLPDTAGLQQVPMGRLVWRLNGGRIDLMEKADHRPEAVASLLQDGACVQLAFGHSRFAAFELLAYGLGRKWPNYDSSVAAMHVRAEFMDGDPAYGRIPVRIVHLDDGAMWSQAVRENHERKNLTALEEAKAIDVAIRTLGMTTEQAGRAFGYERSTAANKLRLLNLPERALDLIQSGWMTERHGRSLLRLAPAPHLQAAMLANRLAEQRVGAESGTVAEWEGQVTRLIGNQPAMPLEDVREAGFLGGMDRTLRPPAWPLTWAPASPAVEGACHTCQYRVVFGNESFPRCSNSKCYEKKKSLWDEKDRERQRAAALAAANAVVPSSATGGQARQIDTPRQIDTVRDKGYGEVPFGTVAAPLGLLGHGLCGKDVCECFCLRRVGKWDHPELLVRPDPENAPDVVYACTDTRALAAKKRRLEAILEPEAAQAENQRRAAQAAQTRTVKDALRVLWWEMRQEGLAQSREAMAMILTAVVPGADASGTVAEMWEKIFWKLAERQCMQTEWTESERREYWDGEKTQRWMTALRGGVQVQDDEEMLSDSDGAAERAAEAADKEI
jgi:ParB-like chromosome segregation protein Spo0J